MSKSSETAATTEPRTHYLSAPDECALPQCMSREPCPVDLWMDSDMLTYQHVPPCCQPTNLDTEASQSRDCHLLGSIKLYALLALTSFRSLPQDLRPADTPS